jgi:pyridoxamine 5'-phosphate oxidase
VTAAGGYSGMNTVTPWKRGGDTLPISTMAIADLRTDYALRGLTEADAGDDPFRLLEQWLADAIAAGVPEPTAMTLATCTPDGGPSARVVLLKVCDERGLAFFTNYRSRKGDELANNPRAAVVLFWPAVERQVRVEGHIELTSEGESDEYFAGRPVNSRLAAWASTQSGVIADRAALEREYQVIADRFAGGDIPRPPHWGGYRLVPKVFEFWQGRPSRLHDRLRFRRVDGTWVRDRLSP